MILLLLFSAAAPTAYAQTPTPTPEHVENIIDIGYLWLYLQNGNFAGFMLYALAYAFSSVNIAVLTISLVFFAVLYIRTGSFTVLITAWIIVGGVVINVIPMAASSATLFLALGIAGLLWRLFRGRG